jgi:hypothetical protein
MRSAMERLGLGADFDLRPILGDMETNSGGVGRVPAFELGMRRLTSAVVCRAAGALEFPTSAREGILLAGILAAFRARGGDVAGKV